MFIDILYNHYEKAFVDGLLLTMKFEVGEHFNIEDEETYKGLCLTSLQKKKTGYVNIKADSGGETKFGIAKNSNPVDIKAMTFIEAADIYYNKYWLMGHCDKLTFPVNCLMFDSIVHHGTKRATQFLQRAFGAEDDGSFGPMTLTCVRKCTDLKTDLNDMLYEREAFFKRNVKAEPKNLIFLDGWLNRTKNLRKFVDKNFTSDI